MTAIGLLARPAAAEVAVITDNHGPVLGETQDFTIYPYYYGGGWGSINPPSAAVQAHQAYLAKLAAFISNAYHPSGIQPFIRQYRIGANAFAGPAAGDLTPAPKLLKDSDIKSIITSAQGASGDRHLPAYGPNVLIMVFPDSGFTYCSDVNICGNDWSSKAYHLTAGANAYYGVLFGDNTATSYSVVSQAVSHEVFEASTDPAFSAWQGAAPPHNATTEVCDSDNSDVFSDNGIMVWSCYDNSIGGAQTTTGYDPPTAFDPISFIVPVMSPF